MKPSRIQLIYINLEPLKTDTRDAVEDFIEARELIQNCYTSLSDTFFFFPEQLN